MKKKNFLKKLSLNKETVANLNSVKGGAIPYPTKATDCNCLPNTNDNCISTYCHTKDCVTGLLHGDRFTLCECMS